MCCGSGEGETGDDLSTWVLATQREFLTSIGPSLAAVGIWGMNQWVDNFSCVILPSSSHASLPSSPSHPSLFYSATQRNKYIFFKSHALNPYAKFQVLNKCFKVWSARFLALEFSSSLKIQILELPFWPGSENLEIFSGNRNFSKDRIL